MQYLGGKTRIAKKLAAAIDAVRAPGQPVWDAFCGGLSMAVALSVNGPVLPAPSSVCFTYARNQTKERNKWPQGNQ